MRHTTGRAAQDGAQVQTDGELKLLRGDEVAEILRVSKSYVYQLLATGAIPVVRLGRAVRVRQEDLRDYVESQVCDTSSFRNVGGAK